MGQGELGWYIHPKGEKHMAVSGFGCKKIPQLVISHTNGPRKQSSYLIGPAVFKSDLLASRTS